MEARSIGHEARGTPKSTFPPQFHLRQQALSSASHFQSSGFWVQIRIKGALGLANWLRSDMAPRNSRGFGGTPSHFLSRLCQAGLPALGLCKGLFLCLSVSLNERNLWSQVNESTIQMCPASASCQEMGLGESLSHSSFIYYSQQPSKSVYFPFYR